MLPVEEGLGSVRCASLLERQLPELLENSYSADSLIVSSFRQPGPD